jgi:hypothetical protein
MTLPEATVGLEVIVTATCKPAEVIVEEAAAWGEPTTLGTLTSIVGASVTVIVSLIVGIVMVAEGGLRIAELLPEALRRIVCVYVLAPVWILEGLLSAALSVNTIIPVGALPSEVRVMAHRPPLGREIGNEFNELEQTI